MRLRDSFNVKPQSTSNVVVAERTNVALPELPLPKDATSNMYV